MHANRVLASARQRMVADSSGATIEKVALFEHDLHGRDLSSCGLQPEVFIRRPTTCVFSAESLSIRS
jgi:hypothetical protein